MTSVCGLNIKLNNGDTTGKISEKTQKYDLQKKYIKK
jgi:hypothetical protein